jgi:hypothetical protein
MNLREAHIFEQSLQNCDPVQQTKQLLKEHNADFNLLSKLDQYA